LSTPLRFSQRFVGTFDDDGETIVGLWALGLDDVHWNDDLTITYRRDTSSSSGADSDPSSR